MWRTALLSAAILMCAGAAGHPSAPEAVAAEQPQEAGAGEPDQEARERVATAAISLLALIAFAGLCLLGLVVFWGYRTRRIVRSPLPPARPLDPFWYLRAPKRTSSDEDEPAQ